ncbi:MAG: [FeFe] hydrogenase H-cluster radical SAM maturase HydG [Elusimicrobia bacterium]|nr:[FeFe] hydrogenase H-cluster radical SAM maturase HydG [Elusimicrobiota bacterium]
MKTEIKNFIDREHILSILKESKEPCAKEIREILKKSLEASQALEPSEAAKLMRVKSPDLWEEIFSAAAALKKKIYDNRIVTFAPLYASNLCVNNCLYCGFRTGNSQAVRRKLSLEEIEKETRVLCGEIGHKRLIFVVGEHPSTGADYIASALKKIYSVKVKTKLGFGQIRRVNVNAAPMSVEDLKKIKEAGIGTYQVFQETYDEELYSKLHPAGTPKSDFLWRLYCHHRAFEAGIDDVALGALFGLGDWRFEILGLLTHARELEKVFKIGPHTVSFPRLEKACGSKIGENKISGQDFKKIVALLRLSVPYAGLIVTAREKPETIRSVIPFCTQRDASTKIGIGAYSHVYNKQELEKQQFELGDTRSLDEVIGELADMGYITSFCTSGYRCGRTGDHIMKLLKSGGESRFCKLNAILTFREWLDDFASEKTKEKGEKLIEKEIKEVMEQGERFGAETKKTLCVYYERIKKGERDLCF